MYLNTTNIFVRLGLLLASGFMLPIGVVVIVNSFEIGQPHIFIMLIFSGSLTTLVGLACLIGFISSFFISGSPSVGTHSEPDDPNSEPDDPNSEPDDPNLPPS